MKNIETKKAANISEAIAIINRLNYRNDTFQYRFSTCSDDYNIEYRHFDSDRGGFRLTEIVVNGKLEVVRFANLFRDIIVDIKLGDFNPDYSDFDNVIDADATIDTDNDADPFKFENIVARFKAQIADADAQVAAAELAELQALEAYRAAQQTLNAAVEKRSEAFKIYNRFGFRQAKDLREKLFTDDVYAPKLTLHARDENFSAENPRISFCFHNDKFLFAQGIHKFATYDNPEQVEAAVNRLKAAIARGDKEFTFPTVDELNRPEIVEVAPEIDSPEYLLAIIDEIDRINQHAPDGWELDYNPVDNNFRVKFGGGSVAELDSLALTKILTPEKFFRQFTPIIDEDFTPKKQFLDERRRELAELEAMRDSLTGDKERLKILDDLIDQNKRDLANAELDLDDNCDTVVWF